MQKFPVFSLLNRENLTETGSQQTASTASTLIKTIGYMGSVKSSHISTYITIFSGLALSGLLFGERKGPPVIDGPGRLNFLALAS